MSRMIRHVILLTLIVATSLQAIEKEALTEYAARREKVAEAIKGSALILFGALEQDPVGLRQERNFYYLTGFDEPDAALLIDATGERPEEILFVPPRSPRQERWTGVKTSPGAEGEKATGIQSVRVSTDLARQLTAIVSKSRRIYALRNDRRAQDQLRMLAPTADLQSAEPVFANLRIRKSPSELALLQKTIDITLSGQDAAARTIAPGIWEYQVEAALEFEFKWRGAEGPSFESIVGSGINSTILHYSSSSRQMRDGDLVVVDVGAEYGGYAGDVTRTYPVNGKFTTRQREIYQIVLDAQKAAMAKVRPGATMQEVHAAAESHIRSKGYAADFPHFTSHHLGLQVHDVGDTRRALEAGMVITVEPGIYLENEALGVRIEDAVVVTNDGYRILSDFPREIADVEALMTRPSGNSRP